MAGLRSSHIVSSHIVSSHLVASSDAVSLRLISHHAADKMGQIGLAQDPQCLFHPDSEEPTSPHDAIVSFLSL